MLFRSGTVAGVSLAQQFSVLAGISVLMTVGVYGLVAGIVKLDDAGLWLTRRAGGLQQALGRGLLGAAPWLMKGLSVVGTVAMFLVGGGILEHGIGPLHHAVEGWVAGAGPVAATLLPLLADGLVGLLAGALVLAGVTLVQRLRKPRAA